MKGVISCLKEYKKATFKDIWSYFKKYRIKQNHTNNYYNNRKKSSMTYNGSMNNRGYLLFIVKKLVNEKRIKKVTITRPSFPREYELVK